MLKQGWFILLYSALTILELTDARVREKLKAKLKLNKSTEEKDVAQKFIDDSGIECGRTKFSAKQQYELGQKKMYPYRFPWAGTLARTVGQNHIPECMVTLIPDADEDGSKIVLTLSSCIQDYRLLKHYKVYFGKRFPIPTRSRHLYSIESITLDKKTPNMAIGNAAVLTLTRAVPINNTFQAACLSKLAAPMPEDSHCVLTLLRGDGKNGQPEHYLVDATTKSNQYCKRIPGQNFIIDSNMEVCATDRRDGFFLAKGGALLCLFQDQWVQYGVYSHSSHIVDDLNYVYNSTMNGKESPAAYINVSKFRLLMQNSQNLNTLGRLNLMRLSAEVQRDEETKGQVPQNRSPVGSPSVPALTGTQISDRTNRFTTNRINCTYNVWHCANPTTCA